jgi:hypothetical protein
MLPTWGQCTRLSQNMESDKRDAGRLHGELSRRGDVRT